MYTESQPSFTVVCWVGFLVDCRMHKSDAFALQSILFLIIKTVTLPCYPLRSVIMSSLKTKECGDALLGVTIEYRLCQQVTDAQFGQLFVGFSLR